jgi:hypothetical protein
MGESHTIHIQKFYPLRLKYKELNIHFGSPKYKQILTTLIVIMDWEMNEINNV